MSTISASINFTISQFRPVGNIVPISALASLNKSESDPEVRLERNDIVIKIKKDQHIEQVVLKFHIVKSVTAKKAPDVDPEYAFIGIAFADENTNNSVQKAFPLVNIETKEEGKKYTHTMTVVSKPIKKPTPALYDYLILVQHTPTGAIGLIDPSVETDLASN